MGGSLLHRPGDHVHPRAVIIRASCQQRQENNGKAAGGGSDPGVGNPPRHLPLGKMNPLAKQNRHQRAQCRQHRHPHQHPRLQGRRGNGKGSGLYTHQPGDAVGGERGRKAGDKRRVVHHADADDHHGEHRGGEGRSEKGGKKSRHSRHGSRPQIPVIQPKQRPHLVADGPAHLQCRPLPSGGAAAQVGQHRSKKNSGQQIQGQPLSQMYCIDDVVGALAFRVGQTVKSYNQKSRQWQAPQKPRVLRPQLCGVFHADVECGTQRPAGGPHYNGKRHPLSQRLNIQSRMLDPVHCLLESVLSHLCLLMDQRISPLPAGEAGCHGTYPDKQTNYIHPEK